jgi:cytochrome c6
MALARAPPALAAPPARPARSVRPRCVAARAALPSAAALRCTLGSSAAALALSLSLALAPVALAADAPAAPAAVLNTPDLFARTCGGCHTGGGNVVELGATLRSDDLARNGYSDAASVAKVIAGGKGKMYGFGEGCAPKGACTFGARLSDADIDRLAAFVLEQAKAGWPAP